MDDWESLKAQKLIELNNAPKCCRTGCAEYATTVVDYGDRFEKIDQLEDRAYLCRKHSHTTVRSLMMGQYKIVVQSL